MKLEKKKIKMIKNIMQKCNNIINLRNIIDAADNAVKNRVR